MAVGIFSNLNSLFSQRSLAKSQNDIGTASQRITSGKRINSAKDDASGLAIAQRLSTFGQGLQVAARNTNDAISMVQTAGGALGGITDNLQRMRELSLQAANGTLSGSDRKSLQSEVNALNSEVSSVVERTTFGGVNVLNEDVDMSFQVGAGSGSEDSINISLSDVGADMSSAGLDSIDISTQQGAQDAIVAIDAALESVSETGAGFGAIENRFESTLGSISNSFINSEASRSRVEDADMAKEMTNLAMNQLKEQASVAMLGHANTSKSLVLKLLS